MEGDYTGWRELREFRASDLTASYLLSSALDGDALLLDLDLCLAPEHPFYEAPRPSQRLCLRPAVVEFPSCDGLEIDGQAAQGDGIADAAAGLGHGRISDLCRTGEGVYRLRGEFGDVLIRAGRPLVRLRGMSG